ncbi:MAG: hypothetical protein AAFR96_03885 [Planctomycetota bacterium]
MSPSTRRGSEPQKKSLVGLSFAFPMQMPRGGTGAGVDRQAAAAKPGQKPTGG